MQKIKTKILYLSKVSISLELVKRSNGPFCLCAALDRKKKAKLKKIKIHSAVFVLLFCYETVAACFYRSSKAEQRVWSSSASLNVLGEALLSKNVFFSKYVNKMILHRL